MLEGYAGTLKRLQDRYASVVADIDREYKLKNKEIDSEAKKKKSVADASNKVSLHNTKSSLLDKGLSHSGESAQADIDHNLARNYAFSEIEEDASREKAQNENARAKAKSTAFTDYLNSVNEAEAKMNSAYADQLNADREYEAERDDEKHDRYVENREYEAERENEVFDRYVTNREYEAEREDEAYDRYADQRDYNAEQGEGSNGGSGSNGSGKTSGSKTDDRIDPDISPQDFVDKIKMNYYSQAYPTEEKRKAAIRKVIDVIINDQTLTYSYRHQVKIYAKAMGLY